MLHAKDRLCGVQAVRRGDIDGIDRIALHHPFKRRKGMGNVVPRSELRGPLFGPRTDGSKFETGILTGPGNHPVGNEIGPDNSESDFFHL